MKYVIQLYYGLWSQMAQWQLIARAALVLGISFLLINLFLVPLLTKIVSLIVKLIKSILKGFYLLIIQCADIVLANLDMSRRAPVINSISSAAEKTDTSLSNLCKKFSAKKRIGFGKLVLTYALFIFFIALPDLVKDTIDASYLPIFSFVRDGYSYLEEDTLNKAQKYPPLFKEKEIITETAAEPSTENHTVIILTLSHAGKDGANIREQASAKSSSMEIVAGDITLIYLGQDGEWIHVETESGKQGWIKNDLVEGIPEGK